MGRAIVRIPIEPLLSRAIVEALIVQKVDPLRNVIDKVIKILAMVVNSQGIFYSSEDTREICEKSKFEEFADSEGDFFSLLNVYEGFEWVLENHRESVYNYVREHFLSRKALFQARDLVK